MKLLVVNRRMKTSKKLTARICVAFFAIETTLVDVANLDGWAIVAAGMRIYDIYLFSHLMIRPESLGCLFSYWGLFSEY